MKGVLPKVRRPIIASFYEKKVLKGKTYKAHHFKKMGCQNSQFFVECNWLMLESQSRKKKAP